MSGVIAILSTFGVFAQNFCRLIEENVLDSELRGWVTPVFSTSTQQDNVVAAILLMRVTQKYFSFMCQMSNVVRTTKRHFTGPGKGLAADL